MPAAAGRLGPRLVLPVGTGQNPGAAIDDTGTAYVGWQINTYEPGDAIQLCVLPPRQRACASLTTSPSPGRATTAAA